MWSRRLTRDPVGDRTHGGERQRKAGLVSVEDAIHPAAVHLVQPVRGQLHATGAVVDDHVAGCRRDGGDVGGHGVEEHGVLAGITIGGVRR